MSGIDLSSIKLVCFDVDGVLTDGRLVIDDQGRESKFFHSRDGHGLRLLIRAGLRLALITGRTSEVVECRAREYGLTEVHQGAKDKLPVYQDMLARLKLRPEETAMAGDDLVDLPIMLRAGLAMAPADAAPEVLAKAHFIASQPGGRGAARQMAEYLLKGQGRWDELMTRYFS